MPNEDTRLKKATGGEAREARSTADQARAHHDGTITNDAERWALRDEFRQEALPEVPEIAGFHTCWLSTTNQHDTIQNRMRWGYTPVAPEEVPGFEHLKMKSGAFEGAIAVNEMVLFKIPNGQYQKIMAEFHHFRPEEEEDKLRQISKINEQDSAGRQLGSRVGDGYDSLEQAPRRRIPTFN